MSIIEQAIHQTIQELASLQFQRMELTQNYGGFSRNRVLQVLPLETRSQAFMPAKESAEALEKKEEEAAVEIDGKKFPLDEQDDINAELQKAGSRKHLLAGHVGNYRCIVFGEADTEQRGPFKITIMHTEEIRTPIAILPMAAVVSKGHITLREIAMDTIVAEKWEQMTRFPDSELGPSMEQKVRHGLKRKTLEFYGIATAADFKHWQKLMRQELLETTLDHELAHAVILGQELSEEEAAIAEGFSGEESNVLTLLNEFLAEFMPPRGSRGEFAGPLARMCEWAKSGDEVKAFRTFYRYLSDSFFYGNPDEAGLTDLTDTVVAMMSSFMEPSGKIDFGRLESELEPIYSEILIQLRELGSSLGELVSSSPHFSALSKEEAKDRSEFWWKVRRRIEKEFPELNQKIGQTMQEAKVSMIRKIESLRARYQMEPQPVVPLLAKILSIPSL